MIWILVIMMMALVGLSALGWWLVKGYMNDQEGGGGL